MSDDTGGFSASDDGSVFVHESNINQNLSPRNQKLFDDQKGVSSKMKVERKANQTGFGSIAPSLIDQIQINQWLQYVSTLGSDFGSACAYLNQYLENRTTLVGYGSSEADFTVWSALAETGPRWGSLMKSRKFPNTNIVRWFSSMLAQHSDALSPAWVDASQRQLAGEVDIQRKSGSALHLPHADEFEKVCLRFAPEPSGYLHIGHAKAALLNQYFADLYGGEMVLRFDDTNPEKETTEFVDNVRRDLDTLEIKYDRTTYTSNYFPEMIRKAEELIGKGKAYVDDTPREEMQKERADGIESKRRNSSVEENLQLWREMFQGTERGVQCCLRGKLDMQDPNKSLRDPVYYRCNPDHPHHRVGTKYKVYPTYDFACPFVDALEGVTHALRSSEYHDRDAQYQRIQQEMGLRKVHIVEFSRLSMVYTILSKRYLKWFVENGKVDGWSDPRMPTVQGIARRGLQVQALLLFIMQQGASKNLNLMEWDKLWTINKKMIDPVCPRHTAVIDAQRVLLTLTNGPEEPFVRIIPRHKKHEGAGEKATTFTNRIWIDQSDAKAITVNEEVTLMDWGNALVKEVEKDEDGNVTKLTGMLHLEGSVKTTKVKLTWLAETSELVKLSLMEFEHLITKKKAKDADLGESCVNNLDILNPCTKKETLAIGDSNMRNLKCGEILQLERKGYFRCDVPFVRASKPIVLFAIPDGRGST